MGPGVGLQRPDVLPIAVRHVAIKQVAFGGQPRENIGGEVDLSRADKVKYLWLENINPGIYSVREHLPPGGFLQETFDRAIFSGDDDAKLQWVRYRTQRHGGQCFVFVVKIHDGAEVYICKDVARYDDERLVELLPGIAHRARRPERDFLAGVNHPGAELGAVAEVVLDGVALKADCDNDLAETVAFQQRRPRAPSGPGSPWGSSAWVGYK